MKKKKSLGQNFLKSETALLAMVSAGGVTEKDFVLEIGPGEGALTEKLLETGCNVLSIEKDRRLIPVLEEKFRTEIKSGKLKLLEGDILNMDMSRTVLDIKGGYKLVANIPYYITGQILRMFLETKNQPESIAVLVQKEVAERIVARDGKESLLSLSVKIYGTPKLVRVVGRGAFSPQPNVDSAILSISKISRSTLSKDSPWITGDNEELFFKVIHAGFVHKRKQLLPNLCSIYSKDVLVNAFGDCDIDLKARAEDITLETWIKLCETLKSVVK